MMGDRGSEVMVCRCDIRDELAVRPALIDMAGVDWGGVGWMGG